MITESRYAMPEILIKQFYGPAWVWVWLEYWWIMSGKIVTMSVNCQGDVREFQVDWSVATLIGSAVLIRIGGTKYLCIAMHLWIVTPLLIVTKGIISASNPVFTPQPLRAPGYCRTPSGRAGGRAAGQTSPVNTLTSIIFHGSFSNLARTFITLRSRTSSIMEVLPH